MDRIYVAFWYIDPNFGPEWNTGGEAELGDDLEEFYQSLAPTGPKVPEGTTFIGWYKMDTNTYEVTDELVTEVYAPVQGEIEIYVAAKYTIDTYTITFQDDQGNTIGTQTGSYGDTITPPSVTPRTGYTMSWVDSQDNTMPSTIQGDATYHTKYTPKSYQLVITYKTEYGITVAETYMAMIAYNTQYSVTSPTVSGLAPDIAVVTGTMPAETVTVNVVYSADIHTLTIYYRYSSGEGQAAETYTADILAGNTYNVNSPSVTHYAPDTATVTGTMPSEDVEIYVYYEPNDYYSAIRATSRQENIYGTLTFTDGTEIDITTSIIQQGSVSITKQCVESEELMFGAVILSELDIAIWSEVSRYAFYDATIELTYQIYINRIGGEEHWVDVPLGIYTVSDAERTGNYVKLTAYDNLRKLDKEIGTTTLIGMPYKLLQDICDICDLTLGITQLELATFPNYDETISISQDTGKSWRDAIKAICQMLGCFAITNADGELVLKKFESTVARTFTGRDRSSVTIADYHSSYYKLEIASLQGDFSSSQLGIDNDLIMSMDAPVWDYGLSTTLQARLDTLLQYLITIDYTPCELDIWGDPTLQCGDRIINVVDEESIESLITSFTWNFHGMMNISSVGKNPYFAEVSDASSSRNATNDNKQNKLVIYELTNRERVTIPEDNATLVAEAIYYALKETYGIYQGTLQINVGELEDTFTNITVLYVINNVTSQPTHTTVSRLPSGKSVIPLFLLLPTIIPDVPQRLSIYVICEDGTAVVEAFDLKSIISGQNLIDNDDVWAGNLNVTDIVQPIGPTIEFKGALETVDISQQTPTERENTDSISAFALSPVISGTVADSLGSNTGIGTYTFAPFFSTNALTTNCAVSEDKRSWVGSGTVGTDATEITTAEIWSVIGFSIFYTGAPQIQLSNDGGTTWKGYDSSTDSWLTTNYMDASEVNALSQSVLEAFRDVTGTEKSIKVKLYVATGTLIHSINVKGGTINA